jgi:hypothetical protein
MTILKPVSKAQFSTSLKSTDGKLDYPHCFTGFSGVTYLKGKLEPVTLYSCYDPALFEALILYCLKESGKRFRFGQKKFTITHDLKGINREGFWLPWERPGVPTIVLSGCTLTGFNIVESDRSSGDLSTFSVTFDPGMITISDQKDEPYREPSHLSDSKVVSLHRY